MYGSSAGPGIGNYTGVRALRPPETWTEFNRAPTQYDTANFVLLDQWLWNKRLWILFSLEGNSQSQGQLADWVEIVSAAGAIFSIGTQDGNTVTPLAGLIFLDGGPNLTTTGTVGPNTVTMSLTGITQHSVQVGGAGGNSLTQIPNGLTGQVFTAQTGADPIWAAASVGADSFPTDSGTATPIAGVLNIKAGTATNNAGSTVEFQATTNTVLLLVTDAGLNTIIGKGAGNLTLTATNNTVLGNLAAAALTSSSNNVIIGKGAGALLAGGSGGNTIVGQGAVPSLVSGTNNIAVGRGAGSQMTTSDSSNIYLGDSIVGRAGDSGIIEFGNSTSGMGVFLTNRNGVKIGNSVGNFTGTGIVNIGIGDAIFQSITTGNHNVALGGDVLQTCTTGSGNSIVGNFGAQSLTTGNSNTGLGNNVFFSGATGLLTGSFNIAIGVNAASGYTGAESRNIIIGNNAGTAGENDVMRIGFNGGAPNILKAFVDGIRGITTTNNNAIAVLVDSAGQLGTVSSSRTKKDNIVDMGSYSDVINQLRPVVFNYKSHAPEMKSVGLIAEEVQEVMPDLVAYDGKQGIHSVKYLDLIPMMLNEIQKLRKELDTFKSFIRIS